VISKVSIRNFQSLQSLDIELGSFTVIVGNSSSGKSAFVRALKAAHHNVRGSSFITAGKKASSVSLQSEDWKITLEKSETQSSYKLFKSGVEREYTKLAGEVPEDIKLLLRADDLNFAGERDAPYLLEDSGQTVARVLGELTNVSTLLEAARESNRRRTSNNSLLKVRMDDFKNIQAKISSYALLNKSNAALTVAEQLIVGCQQLSEDIDLLAAWVLQLEQLRSLSSQELFYIPEYSTLEEAYLNFAQYSALLKSLSDIYAQLVIVQRELTETNELILNLNAEYDRTLKEAGSCPVCQRLII